MPLHRPPRASGPHMPPSSLPSRRPSPPPRRHSRTRERPVTTNDPTPRLHAADLQLAYGRTAALRGASLEVEPGAILALVGPSGSGKTTLLHCMAGLLVPDSGTVRFGDVIVNELTDDERTALRR